MQNNKKQLVDLDIPRGCFATNRLLDGMYRSS